MTADTNPAAAEVIAGESVTLTFGIAPVLTPTPSATRIPSSGVRAAHLTGIENRWISFVTTTPYWQDKGDRVDRGRLELLARFVQEGDQVLQVDCGPGWLPEILRERGIAVEATDLSHVAVARAQARGITARQLDIDETDLPYADSRFRCGNLRFSVGASIRLRART